MSVRLAGRFNEGKMSVTSRSYSAAKYFHHYLRSVIAAFEQHPKGFARSCGRMVRSNSNTRKGAGSRYLTLPTNVKYAAVVLGAFAAVEERRT